MDFSIDYNGITFNWRKIPDGDFMKIAEATLNLYLERLDLIVAYIKPTIESRFGISNQDKIKDKLGDPIFNMDLRQIEYRYHSFESDEIFFLFCEDDEFGSFKDFVGE